MSKSTLSAQLVLFLKGMKAMGWGRVSKKMTGSAAFSGVMGSLSFVSLALSGCGGISSVSDPLTAVVQPGADERSRKCGISTEAGTGRLLLGEGSSTVLEGLPLDLALVDGNGNPPQSGGKISCDKDIVIFVHGWTLGGLPTKFEHSGLWESRGFQTLVFRWHDLSGGPFSSVFVENSRMAATRLENQLRSLYQQLGGKAFRKELRLVGHSFGAKVAAEATSRLGSLAPAGWPQGAVDAASGGDTVPVSRLTLLDPAVFADWKSTELSICPLLRIGMEPSSEGLDGRADDVTEEANRVLAVFSMLPAATKVEVYATNVASTFSYSLSQRWPVQTLTHSSVFGCHVNFEDLNLFEVHNSVVGGYFSSIAEPAPMVEDPATQSRRPLLSASVPTSQMDTTPGWYVLKQGDPRKDWGQHVFRKSEIPQEYFKIELGNKCDQAISGSSECSIGFKYVRKF